MKTSKKIASLDDRFDKRFTPEWWYGFGTTDDINKKGISGIKSFLHEELARRDGEMVKEFKKILDSLKCSKDMVTKTKWMDKELHSNYSWAIGERNNTIKVIKQRLSTLLEDKHD